MDGRPVGLSAVLGGGSPDGFDGVVFVGGGAPGFGGVYFGPQPLTLNVTKLGSLFGSSRGGSAISSSLSRGTSDVGSKMMHVWWLVLFLWWMS